MMMEGGGPRGGQLLGGCKDGKGLEHVIVYNLVETVLKDTGILLEFSKQERSNYIGKKYLSRNNERQCKNVKKGAR